MITKAKTTITVDALIDVPVERIWELWTDPKHIVKWNNASDNWHSPRAENDLHVGGKFSSRMESRDGRQGFDFSGVYNKVEFQKLIEYTLDDGRRVKISFFSKGDLTRIKEIFEAENTNSMEMQYAGWQAILDNFKRYAEKYGRFESRHFEVLINTSAEKAYRIMLDRKYYSDWTSEFNPASHYNGSWEKGSKILFIGTDKDGTTGGMVSNIRQNIPGRFVSIEHIGILKDDKEITTGSEVERWAGALENYTFSEQDGTTLLSIDCDTTEEFASYLSETWPKALNRLKRICEEEYEYYKMKNQIYPCLWFDNQAKQAASFYCSVFKNSEIIEDTPMVVTFVIDGQKFMGLNAGPAFSPNPSISFFVVSESMDEIQYIWQILMVKGKVLMPLGKYDWSEKYGWIQDKFGVGWQISYGKLQNVVQKISPVLMFTNEQAGKTEEAIRYYTSIFDDSSIVGILKYSENENDVQGYVKHAQFTLGGKVFMAMDSSSPHTFRFSEGISFVVDCKTQNEIDYYWDRLSAVPEAEQCGWLKDKFGISWQIVPSVLPKLLNDPDKSERVTKAFLQMKKFEIDKLVNA